MEQLFVIDGSVFLNAIIPSEKGSGDNREYLQRLTEEGLPTFQAR